MRASASKRRVPIPGGAAKGVLTQRILAQACLIAGVLACLGASAAEAAKHPRHRAASVAEPAQAATAEPQRDTGVQQLQSELAELRRGLSGLQDEVRTTVRMQITELQARSDAQDKRSEGAEIAGLKRALTRLQEQTRNADSGVAAEANTRFDGQERRLDAAAKRLDQQDRRLADLAATHGSDSRQFMAFALATGVLAALLIAVVLRNTASARRAARTEAARQIEADHARPGRSARELHGLLEQVQAAWRDADTRLREHEYRIHALGAGGDTVATAPKQGTFPASPDDLDLYEAAERRHAIRPPGIIATSSTDLAARAALAHAAAQAGHAAASARGFDAWYVHGLAAQDRGEYRAGMEAYDRAADLATDVVARARAVNAKATALWQLDEKDAAAGLLARMLDTYDPIFVHNPDLGPALARALNMRGSALHEAGYIVEAIGLYDDVLTRFNSAPDPVLREQVAVSLGAKALALNELGRTEDALAVYDAVLAHFGAATEPPLQEHVAEALARKTLALQTLGQREAAIAACDELLVHFERTTEPGLREHIAGALVTKGSVLYELGRLDQAIAVFDELLARFGNAVQVTLRDRVARGLLNKGRALGQLGRREEEIAMYDDLIARCAGVTDPLLLEQVTHARSNRALAASAIGRTPEVVATSNSPLVDFDTARQPASPEPAV